MAQATTLLYRAYLLALPRKRPMSYFPIRQPRMAKMPLTMRIKSASRAWLGRRASLGPSASLAVDDAASVDMMDALHLAPRL